MICVLCDKLISNGDSTKMLVQGKQYRLHKTCLRKATQKQLIMKGLVKPNDPSFWTKYQENKMPLGGPVTDAEKFLIATSKTLMPERFRATATDDRILGFIELVVADINNFPPAETYTVDTLPQQLIPIVRFGVTFYSSVFMQLRATLDDFSWSDQGVTVAVDQTSKISASLLNTTKVYERMIQNYKKTAVIAQGGRGLSTPKYQSQLGQFLKISLGSSFLWNSF